MIKNLNLNGSNKLARKFLLLLRFAWIYSAHKSELRGKFAGWWSRGAEPGAMSVKAEEAEPEGIQALLHTGSAGSAASSGSQDSVSHF